MSQTYPTTEEPASVVYFGQLHPMYQNRSNLLQSINTQRHRSLPWLKHNHL